MGSTISSEFLGELSVWLVRTLFNLMAAPKSPAIIFSTFSRFLPAITNNCVKPFLVARFSVYQIGPSAISPAYTLKYETSPKCGSIDVLKINAVGHQQDCILIPCLQVLTGGTSFGAGKVLTMKSISRSIPFKWFCCNAQYRKQATVDDTKF
jgi:hypothetical protein